MPRNPISTLLAIAACGALLAPAARADRPFTPRYTLNAHAGLATTGNTLLSCPASDSRCANARAGGNTNNNEFDMAAVDVDDDPATHVSSSATLTLPQGATVTWAGLYWGAANDTTAPAGSPDRDHAVLRHAGAAAATVTARQVDAGSGFAGDYSAFGEVTDYVRAQGGGSYTVSDVRTGLGRGCASGWGLVVVYLDEDAPLRNVSVIDGLGSVMATATGAIPFTVSGFRTPPSGPVVSRLHVLGYEGDRGIAGDSVTLDGTALANSANPSNNVFNSTFAGPAGDALGVPRDPQYVNQLGVDLDAFDVSSILRNDQRTATLTFRTNGDGYSPAVFAIETEIYEPEIALSKSVAIAKQSPSPPGYEQVAEHGDTLTYTIAVANRGPGTAAQALQVESIPAGTTYLPGSLVVDGARQTDATGDDLAEFLDGSREVRFRVGSGAGAGQGGRLENGDAASVSFSVRVGDDLPSGTVLSNQARTDFLELPQEVPSSAFSNVVRTTIAAPDMTIAKARTTGTPVAGGPTTYALTASNSGDAPSQGVVTVTDTLPSDFDASAPVTASGDGWSCSVAGLSVTCTRADRLDRGASFPPILLTGTVSAGFDGTLVNTAFVAGGSETNTTNNSATDTSGVEAPADVGVVKSADPDVVDAGGEFTYALSVANSGLVTARDVVLSDQLPAGVTPLQVSAPAEADCTLAGRQLTCAVGTAAGAERTLAPGQSVRISVRARAETATGGTTVVNTATVSTSTPDVNPSNTSSTATVEVRPVAALRTTKAISPRQPRAGGPITYTVTVANSGPNTATDVSIVDADVPAAVTLTRVTATEGTADCQLAANHISCRAPSIAAGRRVVVTGTGTITRGAAGADLSNAVTALPAQVSGPSGGVGGVFGTSSPSADMRIAKRMPPGVVVGRPFVAVLRARNAGPSPAQNVIVVDTLPRGLAPARVGRREDGSRRVRARGADCQVDKRRIACSLGTVRARRARTVRIRLVARRAGGYVNRATVSSITTDPRPANNRAAAATTTVAVSKRADRRSVRTGRLVTFTIRLRNSGDRRLAPARLCDLLPPVLHAVRAPGARVGDGRRVCWRLSSLAAGRGRTFTVAARAGQVRRARTVTNLVLLRNVAVARRDVRALPADTGFTG